MLSISTPSLIASALQSALGIAGKEPASPEGTEAAPGFAELLNGLADKVGKDASGEEGKAEPAETAIESGKTLPVALPEAANVDDNPDAGTESETVTAKVNDLAAMLVLAGSLPQQQAPVTGAEPALPAGKTARRGAAANPQALAQAAATLPNQPADKPKQETPAIEGRPARAVAISVATPAQAAAPAAIEASETSPVTPVKSKPTRAADLLRIETPQAVAPSPSPAQFAPVDHSAPSTHVPTTHAHAAMPSPTDIDIALDHLVAAREALMPAEAALAIDHAEFGEVSIKFEQSSDGRLSAELSAADPELKRAVTAATAADRGQTMTSDGDGNRSAQTASHRGSTANGDAASGERGQSGTQAGADRDLPQRRNAARSPAGQPATDQRPGVFA